MKWEVCVDSLFGIIIEADELRLDHGILIFLKDITNSKMKISKAFKKWSSVTILEE